MVGFPTLVQNLLRRAAAARSVDFFYVGPADLSYNRGRAYLQQIPGLRAATVYEPHLVWRSLPGGGAPPLAELAAGVNGSRGRHATARFNLDGLKRCGGPLKSRLVQALQARECLRLIERAELLNRSTSRPTAGAPGATRRRRYDSVLRARADLLTLHPTALPPIAQHAYTSLHDCPPAARRAPPAALAPHDYALYGSRALMGVVLGALDGARPAELVRHGCDPHALAAARLARALPAARCVVPANATSVASALRRLGALSK